MCIQICYIASLADLEVFVFQEKLVGQKSTRLHQLILNGEVEEVEKLLSKGGGTDIFGIL